MSTADDARPNPSNRALGMKAMADDKPDLDAIGKRHQKFTDSFEGKPLVVCIECDQRWPCDAERLVRQVRDLEAACTYWRDETLKLRDPYDSEA